MKWPFRSRAEPRNETTADESAVEDVLLSAILSGESITKQQALSVPAVAGRSGKSVQYRSCNAIQALS